MDGIKADRVQNSIGQQCPMPIVAMAKTMRTMTAGQVLEVRADDEGARADIPAWCEQTGNEFLGEQKAADCVQYFVRKKA